MRLPGLCQLCVEIFPSLSTTLFLLEKKNFLDSVSPLLRKVSCLPGDFEPVLAQFELLLVQRQIGAFLGQSELRQFQSLVPLVAVEVETDWVTQ